VLESMELGFDGILLNSSGSFSTRTDNDGGGF